MTRNEASALAVAARTSRTTPITRHPALRTRSLRRSLVAVDMQPTVDPPWGVRDDPVPRTPSRQRFCPSLCERLFDLVRPSE